MYHVMVIDDEPTICQSLTFALEDEYHVYAFTDPREALPLLERTEIAIVLLDLKIGEYDGMKILEEIKRISPSTIVIIMTAYGSIPSSVEAMRKGAFSYATKPLHIDELEVLMQKAEEVYALQSKVRWLSDELEKVTDNNGLIGESAAMREVFTLIDKVKDIGSNILITGESGTGKEVVARTIHYESKRRNKRFQAINCAAIPSHLLESELFGHEKGAFTGALQRKAGLFVLADGGTIFLDEIGEMDLALQGKLLRVLQERKVMPVGGTEEIEIDVRIVAATNRDLAKEVKENRFREDLYYRLNVIPMHLPPLRERKEDIPLLVKFFIRKIGDKMGKPVEGIAEEALRLLQQYSFPGNIRELQNMIERAIALTNSSCIQKDDLPAEIKNHTRAFISNTLIPIYVGETMDEVEKKVILHNLAAFNGNQRRTAQIIGIGERTMRDKIKKYREQK
ncbi:sigma-54-dependent transcriptional regulator [Aneurinibacillus aneurinilyticus]|jgi:two-component system response regulator AtoC|uniref:Sigma-54-dependent Fis family transcriptional regulator n=3 Tax=Aneurinibacillus aneurinilyticus TaxID=1391 RepID=A0A848CXI7_ANEAE|nr:sigma-54 dependent transcriptional regulator [Aneurinibacillus aneurinilyticus]MCI1694332.1 sigma-54 dependent transcriptional regulator [Aneurinibacillus aneurinilyticus]NME98567.1 sigma-54-dependent Fis family transcriptional regulator [Aneurinibacillus aneurinilyticus]